MDEAVDIVSRDFWVKVVGMLQQNWAVVDAVPGGTVRVLFITDASGVFDEMPFGTTAEAGAALKRNGFRRFAAAPDLRKFLSHPQPPYRRDEHPNGPIYSSGRFWTT